MPRPILVLTIFILLLSACTTPASDSGRVDPVVLASTTLLADVAGNVAGDRLNVESLLPVGVDPHSYQPAAQDFVRMANADVRIFNGAGYESFQWSWTEQPDSNDDIGLVIEASAGLGSGTGALDPHFWLDPNNVIVYVENIREGLTHYDPQGEADFQANADAYAAELIELDTWITEQLSQIPAGKRLLVTNHEALGYFAERYGFTVVGTVVESFSSDASPSARQIAELIDQIKATGAPAIFLDASDNPTLADQIGAETGVKVVTDLHLESLTAGAPAATYIDMMKHNVNLIVDALK